MATETQDLSAEPPRRDFLVLVAGAMAATGAAAATWPFIDSMNPAADTLAAGAPIDVDVTPIQPGQQITVLWQSKPIFIVRRIPAELKMLQDPTLLAGLRDPSSLALQQAPYAANWHRSIKPEFLVVVGICTHLGCIPKFMPAPGGELGANWEGGYFCPCHGSRYDLAGRVFKGVPAPYNLPVPPYTFVTDTVIRIGENPPGVKFEFSEIEQT
ncbi:MAG: ubiquinol-cytochrome c reductase iron-sulfur subunit [Aliidongia sp.]